MEPLLPDFRQAARRLRRSAGFTLTAAATLGVGLGATAAIFTVLAGVVLRPLPYPGEGRLVSIGNLVPRTHPGDRWGVSPSGYFHTRGHSRTLAGVGVYRTYSATMAGRGRESAERVQQALVSATLLPVLGVTPALGRGFTARDDEPGAAPVALLSDGLWRRRYGGSPAVLGTSVELDGASVQVVGVLPAGAGLPEPGDPADVWVPERLDPSAPPQNWHAFTAVGRLAPGATVAQVQAEMERFTARYPDLFPAAYKPAFMRETGFRPDVKALREVVVGDVARTLWILLAAVGLVLVVACADVANLFLVRAEARRREVAILSAIGATRARLARQFLAEGLLLGALGGAVGLLLARAAVKVLVALEPAGLPRLHEVRVGAATAAFAAALSVAVGVAVAALPLLRLRASGQAEALREAGRGATAGRVRGTARNALVVAQVAVALVLVASAGLMLQSFRRLRAVDPGIEPRGVLTLELVLPRDAYPTHAAVAGFYRRLSEAVQAVPGVQAAGVTNSLPLAPAEGCSSLFVEDRGAVPGGEPPCVTSIAWSPGAFRALGIRVRGATPGWANVESRDGAVVVTRALAERLWPGQDPVGKGIRAGSWGQPFYRVSGVAEDVRADGLDKPPLEAAFYPLVPMKDAPLWSPARSVTLVVKTAGTRAEGWSAPVHRVVAEMDPNVAVAKVRTMDEVVARSMARTSLAATLIGAAAVVALLLGAVGLYGALSYLVGLRRNEIGIRMALGARADHVAGLVVGHSLALAGLGIGLGLAGAVASTRILRSLLFGVQPADPSILAATAVTMLGVALAASFIPVLRAVRVDPIGALRHD
jgi:putative ABC transport system permease protein